MSVRRPLGDQKRRLGMAELGGKLTFSIRLSEVVSCDSLSKRVKMKFSGARRTICLGAWGEVTYWSYAALQADHELSQEHTFE